MVSGFPRKHDIKHELCSINLHNDVVSEGLQSLIVFIVIDNVNLYV